MKSTRPAISIHMAFLLIDNQRFFAQEVMDDLNISRSSFFRALSDFRCYLQEHRPSATLDYDEEQGFYRLVG